jgi:hypothetical protein
MGTTYANCNQLSRSIEPPYVVPRDVLIPNRFPFVAYRLPLCMGEDYAFLENKNSVAEVTQPRSDIIKWHDYSKRENHPMPPLGIARQHGIQKRSRNTDCQQRHQSGAHHCSVDLDQTASIPFFSEILIHIPIAKIHNLFHPAK